MADLDRYEIAADGDRVFITGVNLDRLNYHQEPSRLICLAAADGKIAWSSSVRLLAEWSALGRPLAAGDAALRRRPPAPHRAGPIAPAAARRRDPAVLLSAPGRHELLRHAGHALLPQPCCTPAGSTC